MDGDNIVNLARAIDQAREDIKSIPTYHVGELFSTIKARLKGEVSKFDHGLLQIELETYSCVTIPRATGLFTDPYDGKQYRIILEPVLPTNPTELRAA